MNMETGNAHQNVVQYDLATYARNHGVHGNALLVQSLQNAAGSLHNGEEQHRQTRYRQELAGNL